MKILFGPLSDRPCSARDLLLRRGLQAYCNGRRRARNLEPGELADTDMPVSVLFNLSAFQQPKHAASAAFIGLINAPEAHLGRNVLVCSRPLPDEIEDFAARNPSVGRESGLWWRNLLRNFDTAILIDRFHFARSTGFAPWIRLGLAGFPLELERPVSERDPDHVLILNHRPGAGPDLPADYAALAGHCRISVLAPTTPPSADLDELLGAAVHIHHDYNDRLPPTALSPFDSLSNGVYTAIRPADGQTPRAESELAELVAQRTYAVMDEKGAVILRFVRQALDRLDMLSRAGMQVNPELERYQNANEDYRAALLSRFAQQVGA